jgi:hypothetical protein
MPDHENGNGHGNGGPVLPKILVYSLLAYSAAITLVAIFLLVRLLRG